jgi:hypothetical protein
VKKKRKKAKGNAQERNSMTKNLSLTSLFSKINITHLSKISRTDAQRLYPIPRRHVSSKRVILPLAHISKHR